VEFFHILLRAAKFGRGYHIHSLGNLRGLPDGFYLSLYIS
jgi:hypothetical protein